MRYDTVNIHVSETRSGWEDRSSRRRTVNVIERRLRDV